MLACLVSDGKADDDASGEPWVLHPPRLVSESKLEARAGQTSVRAPVAAGLFVMPPSVALVRVTPGEQREVTEYLWMDEQGQWQTAAALRDVGSPRAFVERDYLAMLQTRPTVAGEDGRAPMRLFKFPMQGQPQVHAVVTPPASIESWRVLGCLADQHGIDVIFAAIPADPTEDASIGHARSTDDGKTWSTPDLFMAADPTNLPSVTPMLRGKGGAFTVLFPGFLGRGGMVTRATDGRWMPIRLALDGADRLQGVRRIPLAATFTASGRLAMLYLVGKDVWNPEKGKARGTIMFAISYPGEPNRFIAHALSEEMAISPPVYDAHLLERRGRLLAVYNVPGDDDIKTTSVVMTSDDDGTNWRTHDLNKALRGRVGVSAVSREDRGFLLGLIVLRDGASPGSAIAIQAIGDPDWQATYEKAIPKTADENDWIRQPPAPAE